MTNARRDQSPEVRRLMALAECETDRKRAIELRIKADVLRQEEIRKRLGAVE